MTFVGRRNRSNGYTCGYEEKGLNRGRVNLRRGRFYPSRCGGHKNSENAATFSEFLGRRKNLALALIASLATGNEKRRGRFMPRGLQPVQDARGTR